MRSYRDRMRGWEKTAAGLVLTGVVLTGCGGETPSVEQCRAQWVELRQSLGENGSIAPEGTATAERWQMEYDEVTARADGPGGSRTCVRDIETAQERFDRLVDLGSAIQQHDLAVELTRAERDLEHAQELGSFTTLPPPLEQAFADLRSAAPEVHAAVAAAEAGAAEVDLDDGGDVDELVAEIEDAATGVPSYDRGREALEVIGRYELHEE